VNPATTCGLTVSRNRWVYRSPRDGVVRKGDV
jgi:hypothetical protein